MGDVQAWLTFEGEWEAILSRFDVSDFHSKDFFAFGKDGKRVGKYNRWSDRTARCCYGDWPQGKAERFLQELLHAIHLSKLRPLGATVDCRVFFSFSYGERRFLTGGHFDGKTWLTSGAPTKPYFLLFDHCLVEAAHATPAGKKILYVFDQQKLYQSRALEQFGESARTLVEELRSRFGGALYLERYDAPGLQAADLYTHCWNRYLTDPKNIGEIRSDALRILTLKYEGMKQYTRAHLKGMLSSLPPACLLTMRQFPDPAKQKRTEEAL